MKKQIAGFSLIEAMIAVGLGSIVALGSFKLLDSLNKNNSSSNLAYQANLIRREVTTLLQNPKAWQNTMWAAGNGSGGNGSFTCLQGYTDCSGSASNGPGGETNLSATYPNSVTGEFDVYDQFGNLYYASSTTANGFTMNGNKCSTWAASPSNSNCPLRLVLWWVPICVSGVSTCVNPTAHIMAYIKYSPAAADNTHQLSLNPGNYSVNFLNSPVTPICPSQIINKCILPNTNATGAQSGTCNTSGTCSYTCNLAATTSTTGSWSVNSNACL